MSLPSSTSRPLYRKPRADVYTVMLIFTLIAIILAGVLLYFEMKDYPDKPPWTGGPATVSAPAITPWTVPAQAPAVWGMVPQNRFV